MKKQGALKGSVGLNSELTFYSKHGDYIALISQSLAAFYYLFFHSAVYFEKSHDSTLL